MDLLIQYVSKYLEEGREKDPSHIADIRVTRQPDGIDALWWEFEADINNGHVTYTEVFRMNLSSEPKGAAATRHWRTLTSKTRLHVPVSEVPLKSTVYLVDGSGPYLIDGVDNFVDSENLYHLTLLKGGRPDPGNTEFASSNVFVAVPFYYARGEGAMAGGVMLATEAQLAEWACANGVTGGLNRLVGGCKFDLWAASSAANPHLPLSVFGLPK